MTYTSPFTARERMRLVKQHRGVLRFMRDKLGGSDSGWSRIARGELTSRAKLHALDRELSKRERARLRRTARPTPTTNRKAAAA
jgi:hypothetical protein